MISSLLSSWLAQAAPTAEEIQAQVTLDSQILTEQFYFWTVVIMWLIHAGFMAYEAGAARRKNVMSTAMKNILTIAVVTPSFYYFGWYIYGCFEEGWPKDGHGSPTVEGLEVLAGFCQNTAPWAAQMGPNLQDHVSAVFFLAFLLFSWTTASIMSGALIERVRLSAFLILAVVLGSGVWIMDAAWGWSGGGWLVTRYGFHDSIASLVVHGVAGAFTLGVLLNLGPRIGKYTVEGAARTFRGHNTHLTLMGLMLIFTGFYGFYAACLVIQSTVFPGLAQHLLLADDPGRDRVRDHVRLRRWLHGRLVREQGRPVLDPVRRSRRRDLGVCGRRRLPPVARVPALDLGRNARGVRGHVHREEAPDRRRGRRSGGSRRVRLLRCPPRRDLRRRLSDRHQQRRVVLRWPARWGCWPSSRWRSSPATS